MSKSEVPAVRVVHYQRKQKPSEFSLERVFEAVRNSLPCGLEAETWSCRFESRRFIRRLLNVVEAPRHQGDLNHIVGDIHYIALAMPKRKTILTIHDCVSLQITTGLRRQALLWLWYRLPVRHVAAVTVVSGFTRNEVLRWTGCAPDLVRIIPDPVPKEFTPSPKPFKRECPVILQVGTREHNKNVCRVAEALRGIPCRLDVIGKLTVRQRQALEANSVSYTEQWDLSAHEVVERYRECDLLVFASTYEGFGMPIIEANVVGRPVIASNIGPMPEVAGPAACLVDPYNSGSIRNGMLRVIRDSGYREYLVAQGFENAKRFQADVIGEQYAALYREVYGQLRRA